MICVTWINILERAVGLAVGAPLGRQVPIRRELKKTTKVWTYISKLGLPYVPCILVWKKSSSDKYSIILSTLTIYWKSVDTFEIKFVFNLLWPKNGDVCKQTELKTLRIDRDMRVLSWQKKILILVDIKKAKQAYTLILGGIRKPKKTKIWL